MVRIPASRASAIVRSLATVVGEGNYIFNDRRKNGGRSFKVWGWKRMHYDLAVEVLEKHGFTARIVDREGSALRLYVEPGQKIDLRNYIQTS